MVFEVIIIRRLRSIMFTSLILFILITSLFFTCFSLSYINNSSILVSSKSSLSSDSYNSLNSNIETINHNHLITEPDLSKSYKEIDQVQLNGDNFSIIDDLSMYHDFSLNLTFDNTHSSSFTIDEISGYNTDQLNYNILNVSSLQDYYPLELGQSKQYYLSNTDNIALAQGFEVLWDNAVFFGANLSLSVNRIGTLGSYELELFVVKANDTDYPDLNNIISYEVTSTCNENNYDLLDNQLSFYDFEDTVLVRGKYYLIANLSSVDDNPSKIIWNGMVGYSDGATYFRDSSGNWNIAGNLDLSLVLELLPSDEEGKKLYYPNPLAIDLEVNDITIDSFSSIINNTGIHIIQANTSVEIFFGNLYSFSQTFIGFSSINSHNSSCGEFENHWNIKWNINNSIISTYDNQNRTHFINTPNDWKNVSFSFHQNDTCVLQGAKIKGGYLCYLNSSIYGGNFSLITSSPNYISHLDFYDDRGEDNNFALGYWFTNGTHAIGKKGSRIIIDVAITGELISGSLNFTLFNSSGQIIPLKSSLPSNIVYSDETSYTTVGEINVTTSLFAASISLDPSVYGSDQPGYWTIFIYWTNGTEIGFFTKKVVINTSTQFDIKWEVLPCCDNWINYTLTKVVRFSGDSLKVVANYYKVSEPFFSGNGHVIENASISYLTSWRTCGCLSKISSQYCEEIKVNSSFSNQSIEIFFTGSFLQEHIIEIDLVVFHKYKIEVSYVNIETNPANDVICSFQMINITDPNNITMFPDTINLQINGNPVSDDFYSLNMSAHNIELTIMMLKYGITSDSQNISVTVSKSHYKADYLNETYTILYTNTFVSSINNGLSLYYISLIATTAVGIIISITLFMILRSRKNSKLLKHQQYIDKVNKIYNSSLSIKKILLVHCKTSLPLFELDLGSDMKLDPILIAGFFSAVSTMGGELLNGVSNTIKKIEYKNLVVTSSYTDMYTAMVFSEEELLDEFEFIVSEIAMWFELMFGKIAVNWDGSTKIFEYNKKSIEEHIINQLYLWVYYPCTITGYKKNIKKLDNISKEIISFVKEKEKVSINSIIENFEYLPSKEVLGSIFSLVESNNLTYIKE